MKKVFSCLLLMWCSHYVISQDFNEVSLNDYFSDVKSVPMTPQSSELGLYGQIPVSFSTGVPNISIPLHTVNLDGVKVPISISYHASGIRVDDISTCVGLKWTLQAGGIINREINGSADEMNGWIGVSDDYLEDCSNSRYWEWWCRREQVEHISNNGIDLTPDDFTYNFLGNSGSFYFNNKGRLIETSQSGLRIEKQNVFEEFLIHDQFGVEYKFKPLEHSWTETSDSKVAPKAIAGSGVTGWMLNSIETKNKNKITFAYKSRNIRYNVVSSQIYKDVESSSECNCCPFNSYSSNVTSYDFTTGLVESITTPNQIVKFIYEDDQSLAIWKTKLNEVIVCTNEGVNVKKIKFKYDTYSGSKRLRLRAIQWYGFEGRNEVFIKEQKFNYNGDVLPIIGSYSKDRFGFYNGANNIGLIPVDNGINTSLNARANRKISQYYITNGILNEIIYPTKGKTKFYFEANIWSDKCAPGVRIKKQINYDLNNEVEGIESYVYSNLAGNIKRKDNFSYYWNNTHSEDCCQGRIFRSTPITNGQRTTSGFYYKDVRKNFCNLKGQIKHYEDYQYVGYHFDNRIVPYLKIKRSLHENGDLVQKEEYSYDYSYDNDSEVVGFQLQAPYMVKDKFLYCSKEGGRVFVPGVTAYYYKLNKLFWSKSKIQIESKSLVDYYKNSEEVSKIWSYSYGDNNLIDTVETITSRSPYKIRKVIKYPNDYSTDTLNLNIFKQSHTGIPICILTEKINSDHVQKLNGIINEFDKYGNKIKEFKFVSKDNANWQTQNYFIDGFSLESIFDYDSGRLIYSKGIDKINYHYCYDSNNINLLAMKFGSDANKITSIAGLSEKIKKLEQIKGEKIIDQKETLKKLNEDIRTLSEENIITYTYAPLVGMTSQTDPNGITTYYEYDDFGRLEFIKDDDGNIIKAFNYHFREE